MKGEAYWDESAYYAFTLAQIEQDLEEPSRELHALCLELVSRAVRDEALLARLAIPENAWDAVRASWDRRQSSLYGRFDFAYNGGGPAKLLEYNADTPTALYETGVFQWLWLEELIGRGELPADADQFNSLHDKLVARLATIAGGRRLHLTCMAGEAEDRGTILYIEDCARQGGLETRFAPIEQIGFAEQAGFLDQAQEPIDLLFKLYPWEWMFREQFGAHLDGSATQFVEPPWKAILSNKGILPLLWEMAPNHPNLLPAYFEDD
ncbi:MAG TPA: glutathionylspermidine synthase family protein, partial [Beijerinckiaceae bacterium]|nr:glutathionylspermidine synthase family protein [Beijerinckiaceae bacterium]